MMFTDTLKATERQSIGLADVGTSSTSYVVRVTRSVQHGLFDGFLAETTITESAILHV